MPVFDIAVANLDNESDLLDGICDELVANHHFVDERDNGTVGSNDKERWVQRTAANTFHGDVPITVGFRKVTAAPNDVSLEIILTHETYDIASATDTRVWADFTGTPIGWTTPASSPDSVPFAGGLALDATTPPYIRARLITSPGSGTASAAEELYFYVVLETETNKFTSFGFGEMVKLVPFAGGLFQTFNRVTSLGLQGGMQVLLGCGIVGALASSANAGGMPGAVFSSDWGPALADTGGNGWLQMSSFGDQTPGLQQNTWPCIMYHPQANLGHLIARSPSGFSLQSQRWPCVAFGSLSNDHENSYLGHAPMGILPDLFIADINNVASYGVFSEANGERFMVVPYLTKAGSGANSSEKFGALIRNPALTVTINP